MKPICLLTPCLIGLLFLSSLTSCIKDDLSGCGVPGGVYQEFNLYFSFTVQTYASRGFDPAELEGIYLFVFDEEGKFVRQEIDESPKLSADYYIPVKIETGTYDFVVWGNVKDCYSFSADEFIVGETTKEELLLRFETGSNNRVTEKPHPLFFGDLGSVKVLDKENQRFTMPLVRNTYTINVTTKGLTEVDKNYTLQISDRGNSYKFDNTYASSTEVTYITPCSKDASHQPYGSLTIQRLIENRQYARLKIENATDNEIVYEENLIELILLLRQLGVSVDFTRTYEYDIELDFGPDPTGSGYILTTITINGWVIVIDDYNVK